MARAVCRPVRIGGASGGFSDLVRAGRVSDASPITTGGCMTVSSYTPQLLYEIQGMLYYNCDVTANLEGINIEQIGEGQVKVSGVKGLPPPPMTIVGIAAFAGGQAE
jgi:hypothetical protein